MPSRIVNTTTTTEIALRRRRNQGRHLSNMLKYAIVSQVQTCAMECPGIIELDTLAVIGPTTLGTVLLTSASRGEPTSSDIVPATLEIPLSSYLFCLDRVVVKKTLQSLDLKKT